MISVVLFGTWLAISSGGTFEFGDDVYINGNNDYQAHTYTTTSTFRATNDFLTNGQELDYNFMSDLNTLELTMAYNFEDMVVLTESENYLYVDTSLSVSSDGSTWETLDTATDYIINDNMNTLVQWGGLYKVKVTTNDYFNSPTEMLNKYFKVSATINYKNVAFDSDCTTYGFYSSTKYSVNGASLTERQYNYTSAYNNGYNNGYNKGYSEGETNGYSNGYNNGYAEGTEHIEELEEYSVQSMLTTILDYPLKLVKNVTNVELFGVNLYSVITFTLSIALIAFVIKYFI